MAGIRERTLKEVWELFNKHGISVIPLEKDTVVDVTISCKSSKNELPASITFSRPAEPGILSFLPDKEWQALKAGKVEQGSK